MTESSLMNTFLVVLVPQLNVSTFFFTLARFFGRQAVACPSPLLSTSKPFLAIFTISSHQVTSCVESSNHLYCYLFHFNLASFKYETIPYAIPHVSLINSYRACFHIVHRNSTINKPLHELHLHCCLVFELDCFQQYIILAFINYLWDNLFHVQHLANMLDLLSRCHSIIQNPLKGLMHFQISKHVHPGSKYPNAFGISKTKIANQIEKASRKFLWIFRPSQTFRDKLGNFEEHRNSPPNFILRPFQCAQLHQVFQQVKFVS